MKIYLSGSSSAKAIQINKSKFVLESFYYIKKRNYHLIDKKDNFMLDSGAFSMFKSKKQIDIDEYVDEYIEFIKEHDINLFFELDIDCLVGYDRVKKIRKKINRQTRKRCIPVWHKSRGILEFRKMCRENDYVAIGGIASKEIKPSEYFLLNSFCDYAHENGCKIHGLGFSPAQTLHKYRFDSVDSTTWITGTNMGDEYYFTQEGGFRKFGGSLKPRNELLHHNFGMWLKFQTLMSKKEGESNEIGTEEESKKI